MAENVLGQSRKIYYIKLAQYFVVLQRRYINPRPYRGGWCNPPEVFSGIAKKRRRVAPPGFGLPYGANLAQFLAKKFDPVRLGHGAMTS